MGTAEPENTGRPEQAAGLTPGPPSAPRRKGPRRADAAGTGPASADGPEPQLAALRPEHSQPEPSPDEAGGKSAGEKPGKKSGEAAGAKAQKNTRMTEHERWLLEQRPPHWG